MILLKDIQCKTIEFEGKRFVVDTQWNQGNTQIWKMRDQTLIPDLHKLIESGRAKVIKNEEDHSIGGQSRTAPVRPGRL